MESFGWTNTDVKHQDSIVAGIGVIVLVVWCGWHCVAVVWMLIVVHCQSRFYYGDGPLDCIEWEHQMHCYLPYYSKVISQLEGCKHGYLDLQLAKKGLEVQGREECMVGFDMRLACHIV